MTQPTFSVVIPSHNRPESLKRAVAGLELQSMNKQQFEVIIILSPNDLSFDWLKSYKSSLHLKFLTPEEDVWHGRNVSFKRNYGAKIAQGSWIAFTDDDCIPTPYWLTAASQHVHNKEALGIEGLTVTPEDSPKTLTWKGMQQLSVFGGYQTCNIFYRKSVFTELSKGFDSENFPWFLEDTDLAWTVLDLDKKIISEPACVVVHPVGPQASWRILHEAKGAGLKVKLWRKHPRMYEEKNMKALRWNHYIYLSLQLAIVVSVVFKWWPVALMSGGVLGLFSAAHMFKLFRGLEFTFTELFEVAWRMMIFAPIALGSIMKESLRSRIPFSQFLRIIKP
ncbi:MAG: glycosyltransferase family 2 protein [Bdellovibrionales bacterium]|nr:glycosyltransferase family 2 protein [Bdellovibrionales bacterium]